MKRIHAGFLPIFAVAALVVLAGGCSDKATTPVGDSNIALDLNFESPKLLDVEQGSFAVLKVIAPDIEDTIAVSGAVNPSGTFELEILVPTGPARVFILELYGSSEVLLYRGIQVANVRPGVVNRIPVNMVAMVPMLKLTPKSQTVTGGDDVLMELRVYNLDSLTAVDARIEYGAFGNAPLLQPLRSSPAPGLPPTIDFIGRESDGAYRIRVADSTGAVFSAGPQGLTLADLHFGSQAFADPEAAPLTTSVLFDFFTVLRNGVRVDSAVYPEVSDVTVLPLEDRVITFPDSVLQAEIALNLTDSPDGTIYLSDALGMRFLNIVEQPIADITGICQLANLTQFEAGYNEFSDITPVGELKLLTSLTVNGNEVTDISPIRSLPGLRYLNLYDNLIGSVSALEALTNLRQLELSNNNITDLSPLRNLVTVSGLGLAANNISNISALESLDNLYTVNLANNQITDISALVNNSGIGPNDIVDLRGNPLSADGIRQANILVERGVTVYR